MQAADLAVNLCQPHRTGPDHKKNRKTVNLYQCHQTSVRRDSKCLSVSNKCKLGCCKSCTYCSRAGTKERHKSGYCKTTSVIKICEQYFLCRSIVFCQTCTKCPKCCTKSACRGQTEPVLGNLGSLGGQTQSNTMLKEPFQTRPNLTRSPTIISFYVHPHSNLYLLEALHELAKQKCSRIGQKSRISGLLQPAIFGPKFKQQMETHTRSEQSQQVPQGKKILNGDTRNDPDLPTDRGVGQVHRFQGRLLPHTNTTPIKEISEISYSGQNIPIQSTTIWPVHSSLGVHCSEQRGQTDGFAEGYKNPPVPRQMVVPGQIQTKLGSSILKH